MTHQMLIVFAVLAVAVGLFVWGRPRADIVGLLVVVALMSSRVLMAKRGAGRLWLPGGDFDRRHFHRQ